jgi:WD40 repeat protein
MALIGIKSRLRDPQKIFRRNLILFLVLGLTAACQIRGGGWGAADLGTVHVDSFERLPFTGLAKALVYSKGGGSLIVGGCQADSSKGNNPCAAGLIQVWSLEKTGSPTAVTFPKSVTALAVLPDGSKWVAGDAEGRLILSTTKAVPKPFHQKGEITSLAFSPDGKWVASGSLDPSFPLGLMDVTTGGVVKVKTHFEPVAALAFSPDGKTLAVGMTRGGIVLWDFTTSSVPEPVAESFVGQAVTSAAFSPDGELLAYGMQDGKVVIVSRDSGQPTAEYKGSSPVNALAFSPDGTLLALGQENGKVLLIDSVRATQVWGKRHILPVSDLAFSPDGASLAVAAQQSVFLYFLGEGGPEPGSLSRPERSTGIRMKGRTLPGREASLSPASSRRVARIMQIAQDEFLWLLPFNRLVASSVQAMVKLVPGATVEPAGVVSAQRLALNAGGRSLALDLGELEQAEGREGLHLAVRAYESARRFLLVSSPNAAASLEDAAIRGVLAELGPGLRLGPWPAEGPALRVNGALDASTISTLPGADQRIKQALLAGRVAYFKLARFSRLTARRVQQWLVRGTGQQRHADAAVLDLRDNPGSDLESVIATARTLMPAGHLVAEVIARKNGDRINFRSDGSGSQPGTLVVLVNERTAGTAELLACALQASGAGVLVGTRTAGVDEVYTAFRLAGGDGLRVSTGRFLCPDGQSVRWKGRTVDVEVGPNASTGVAPIRVSPTDTFPRPRLASQFGVGLPTTADQQLRVAVDLALCLSQARPRGPAGQQAVTRRLDSASLLSACQ